MRVTQNDTDEHACKNSQQNTNKSNPTKPKNDKPRTNGIYPREARMTQHMQNNKHIISTMEAKIMIILETKHLIKFSIPEKISQRKVIPQHNKGYI